MLPIIKRIRRNEIMILNKRDLFFFVFDIFFTFYLYTSIPLYPYTFIPSPLLSFTFTFPLYLLPPEIKQQQISIDKNFHPTICLPF